MSPFTANRFLKKRHLIGLGCFCSSLFFSWNATAHSVESIHAHPSAEHLNKKCAYIASYSSGYDWQDRLESRLKQLLAKHCKIETFYMNSKRLNSHEALSAAGNQAKQFIDQLQPDLVIVSDDNAVKYVLSQYYSTSDTPFVFCGVNSSGRHYHLPYPNTTGMIETSPYRNLLKMLFSYYPTQSNIAFLTTTGTTANKNIEEFTQISQQKRTFYTHAYQAKTEQEWRQLFKKLQEDPSVNFIILGNNAAFPAWNHLENLNWVKKYTQKITIATQEWMMPYSTIGYTKIPEEQGEWAALASIEVLKGTPIHYLATVPNQHFNLWKNSALLPKLKQPLPIELLQQARPLNPDSANMAEK